MNPRLIFIFCFFFGINLGYAQNTNYLIIDFEIDGNKSADFSRGVDLIIYANNRYIPYLKFVNGLVVPDFEEQEKLMLCFIYKKDTCCFGEFPREGFLEPWVFGIDKKPFTKEHKRSIKENRIKQVKNVYYLVFGGLVWVAYKK